LKGCAETAESEAWLEFHRRFHALIAGVALRTARQWGEVSPATLDDLVQDVYVKLCSGGRRLLREFHSYRDDAVFGYLKAVTANLVRDHFKKAYAGKRGGGQVGASADAGVEAVDETAMSSVERQVLLNQIEEVLEGHGEGAAGARDRTVFWLHYRHGMTARAIASLPAIDLTQKGVESVLHRLTQYVRRALAENAAGRGEGKSPRASLSE